MKEWIENIIKNIRLEENEDELLKECLEAGMTYQKCAEMLGSTFHEVRTRAIKFGIVVPKKHWSKEEKELLKKYIQSGMTHEKCAEKLGRTLKSVKQMIYVLRCYAPKKTHNVTCNVTCNTLKKFGFEMNNEEIKRLSKKEKAEACLNCTLPECINCFGADRRGRGKWIQS